MIPQNEQNRNDIFDFLVDGMHEKKERMNPETGLIEMVNEFNPRVAWAKSHIINQPFGRHEFERQNLEGLANLAFHYMSYEAAVILREGILMLCTAYDRSIDAKSSEIYKDKHNTQSALVHILSKNKVEKQLTLKGDKGASISKAFGLSKDDDDE